MPCPPRRILQHFVAKAIQYGIIEGMSDHPFFVVETGESVR